MSIGTWLDGQKNCEGAQCNRALNRRSFCMNREMHSKDNPCDLHSRFGHSTVLHGHRVTHPEQEQQQQFKHCRKHSVWTVDESRLTQKNKRRTFEVIRPKHPVQSSTTEQTHLPLVFLLPSQSSFVRSSFSSSSTTTQKKINNQNHWRE